MVVGHAGLGLDLSRGRDDVEGRRVGAEGVGEGVAGVWPAAVFSATERLTAAGLNTGALLAVPELVVPLIAMRRLFVLPVQVPELRKK